jgi:hypothetical protein
MPIPVRADALPEFHQYVDEGCAHYPLCLACPLPCCRFDVPGGIRSLHNRERDPFIVRDYWELRLPVDVVADRYGVSTRTVFRVVGRARGLLHA